MRSHAASMIERAQEMSRDEICFLTKFEPNYPEGRVVAAHQSNAPILNRPRITISYGPGSHLSDVRAAFRAIGHEHHYDRWYAASGSYHKEKFDG